MENTVQNERTIRASLIVSGLLKPHVPAASAAVKARRHEMLGRKQARARAVFEAAVRRAA